MVADNGGAITIINKEDYITDCNTLLEDSRKYHKTTTDMMETHLIEAENLLNSITVANKQVVCVRGAPWSAANRLHGQRTGAFSWRPVLGLSRKTYQFRLDPTQNCAPGWWYDRV